jgi:hypothetical protein
MPDFFSISSKISKSKNVQQKVADKISAKVEKQKEKTLKEFNTHPVTEEIEEGETADNISGTLDGYGNLFSFIGFHAGDDPIERVRDILTTHIRFFRTPINIRNYENGKVNFSFRIRYPELRDFDEDTKYPDGWRDGSWLKGIEQGIYGLQSYLYDPDFGKYVQSRSTAGLQARQGAVMITIRDGKFKNTKYMSTIINNFISNVKSSK